MYCTMSDRKTKEDEGLTDDTLRDYARRLNGALKSKSGYSNYNRDASHASIVLFFAFHHAEKRVLLLSQKLDTLVYSAPWVLEEVGGFLRRSGKLDVLVETELEEGHPMRQLRRDHPDRLSIARVPERIVETYSFNFMVVDDRGYRFEHDRENYSASVAFDKDAETHRELVHAMQQRFRDLKAQSIEI